MSMDETWYEHKEEEENYFVSMTDMMIGLVFIFIIMLMYYALQNQQEQESAQAERTELALQIDDAEAARQEADAARREADAAREAAEATLGTLQQETAEAQAERTRLSAEIAAALARQQELLQQQEQLERINAELRALSGANAARAAMLRDIEARLTEAGITVQIDPGQGILRLRDQVLFATGQSELTDRGEETLRIVADVFGVVLPCYASGVVRPPDCTSSPYAIESLYIEGHTDDVPISGGRFQDNLALSAERATNTYRFLVETSPLVAQLCLPRDDGSCSPILGVSGYGEQRPVAPNDTPENRALNRRIDFRVIMITPNLEELQADLNRELEG